MEQHLTAYTNAIGAISTYLKPDCPLRRIHVFLCVARQEPATLDEIARYVRAPTGTIYDDLKALGKKTADGRTGAAVVNEVPNAHGGAHTFGLTGRGRMAIEKMRIEWECAFLPDDEAELGAYLEAKRHTRG